MRRYMRIPLPALLASTLLAAAIALPHQARAWTAAAEAPPRKPDAPDAGGAVVVTDAPSLPRGADADLRALDARARTGDLDAQIALAEHFVSGTTPTALDVKRAIFWYEQAAGRGDADASWALASLYRNRNELVAKSKADMDEAVKWYRQAADQGHAEAMYDLGLLYAEGNGLPDDSVQAAQWFERAADAGIARALFMLGILFEQGVDGAPDLDIAAGWYAQAAAAGDATAEAALKRLADGQGNVMVAELPFSQTASAAPPAAAKEARSSAKPVPVTKAGVKEIQQRLSRLGYKPGKADGHLGKRTTAAIRAYQKAENLSVDGRPTQALLDHLRRRA